MTRADKLQFYYTQHLATHDSNRTMITSHTCTAHSNNTASDNTDRLTHATLHAIARPTST